MLTDSSPYVIAQLIGGVISAMSALMAWRKRKVPGGLPLALLFLAATEWGLADALGLMTQQIEYKIWWEKLAIIGASTVAIFFLIFALEYIRRQKLLATRGVLYLWIVPFSLMALAVTNEWHGLFWDNSHTLINQYGGVILIKEIGYWIHVAYSYSLRVIGTIVIVWTIIRYPARYRSQAALMLAGALTPWISNAIYIFFPFTIMGIVVSRIELHPIFFSLSGIILGWGILRYRLLEATPIARDAILEIISDGVIVVGADNRVMDINPAAHRILHLDLDPLDQPIEIALKAYPALIDQMSQDEITFEIDIAPHQQQVEAGISILKDANDQVGGKVIALRDITERKRAERENARLYEQSLIEIKERKQAQENLDRANKALAQQLAENKLLQAQLLEQAVRDPITGVFNRRYLDETLEREIFRATREQTFVSIVMLDIDHFKQFNDTYGHAAGDLMLKKLGEMLTRKTRKGDIACRYGGEEFAVIMPGAALETALQRAEIWRAEIEALTVAFETHTLRGTISLGVACFPQHGSNGREVLICADRAMYSAKQNGRNKVCMYQAGT